jgi:hypothetical protein
VEARLNPSLALRKVVVRELHVYAYGVSLTTSKGALLFFKVS